MKAQAQRYRIVQKGRSDLMLRKGKQARLVSILCSAISQLLDGIERPVLDAVASMAIPVAIKSAL